MDSTEHSHSATTTIERPVAEPEAQPETGGAGGRQDVHLPPTSLWPITLAFAITIAASGLVLNWLVSIPGFLIFVWAVRGWAQELLHAEH